MVNLFAYIMSGKCDAVKLLEQTFLDRGKLYIEPTFNSAAKNLYVSAYLTLIFQTQPKRLKKKYLLHYFEENKKKYLWITHVNLIPFWIKFSF